MHPDRPQPPQPRRFIYRSAQPDTQLSHPARRRTDIPHALNAEAICNAPQPLLLRMCACFRLN